MDAAYKIRFFLVLSLYISTLQGAIGCKKTEHTVNYWNVSKLQYVKCSCPCNNIVSDYRGQCTQCGHFGLPGRGEVSRRVLLEQEVAYN